MSGEADGGKPLPVKFMSHGTLESRDLAASRKFYEEFLGLETVQTSNISIMIRRGGLNTYAVVESKRPITQMNLLNHNGLDVDSDGEVDACHQRVTSEAEKWGLKRISNPMVQHGTYSFYFYDADDNAWEILSNPTGGYSWMFDGGDLEGRGHMDRNFERPKLSG